MRLAGLVEYEGTEFSGWAVQPGMRTVEETLSEALETVLRHPVKLSVAGRTDAGVHASGQVVSFDADTDVAPQTLAYKTTAVLPKDLAVRRCVEVPESFDARRSARSRGYEYRVLNSGVRSPLLRHHSAYFAKELDFGILQRMAEMVRGKHDFRAFTPSRSYHSRFERVVTESRWEKSGELFVYRISADSFLYGMVRALVGTMLEAAQGRRNLESLERLLAEGERTEAGAAAPARGLTLTGVGYEDIEISGGDFGGE